MPHFPKPFFVKSRGVWRVQLHGKQLNLGPNKADAFRHYHELLSQPAPVVSELVLGLIDGFLDWCQRHRSPRTYEWYKDHLQSFLDSLSSPDRLRVDDLKPFHVLCWVDAHPSWGSSHRRGAITAAQRAFSWAEKLGYIVRSPIRHIEKPEYGRREQLISSDEFAVMLTHVKDQAFRDILEFSWETGARPQETRVIETGHVNLDLKRVELPPALAKGKKRWRMIYLTDKATDTVKRLACQHSSGLIFRNTDSGPWTAEAFNCRFGRLKKKLGRKYALYSFRHSYANRLLRAGLDSLTVSQLLGHVDGVMLARVYSHLEKSNSFLREELRKGMNEASPSYAIGSFQKIFLTAPACRRR